MKDSIRRREKQQHFMAVSLALLTVVPAVIAAVISTWYVDINDYYEA